MGTDLKFWSLVEVFESLAQPSTKATKGSALSRKEKEAKLAELMFERYRAGPHQEASLYPLARLLCPRLDQKGRAMYQLKEKGLADVGPLGVPTTCLPSPLSPPLFPSLLADACACACACARACACACACALASDHSP